MTEELTAVGTIAGESELTALFNARLEEIEAKLLQQPDCRDLPVTNHFADGVYFREGVIPAGHWGLGHSHLHEELTIIFSGRALLGVDGKVSEICGPCVIKTAAGVRKLLLAITDVHGGNIFPNPTNETDVGKLEKLCIEKSATRLRYEQAKLQ